MCELVGLFLLKQVKTTCKGLDFGLYRDDGLGVTKNLSGPGIDKLRKKIVKLFQSHGLKITIECNLQLVNFLDVTLDLQNGKYWPFRKQNEPPLYIHKESNHPPNISKQLPKMIEDRISSISCNKEEFDKVKDCYNSGLKNSGFDYEITYSKQTPRKTRRRNILWFNPPYNASVKTNIGKSFLELVDKHFPRHHRFHKIFNRNTIKISYSCSPDMNAIISRHNKKILSNDETTESNKTCNCRKQRNRPLECPLDGRCLEKAIIYKATVTTSESSKFYIDATEQSFKKRYPEHKDSFSQRKFSTVTRLSK